LLAAPEGAVARGDRQIIGGASSAGHGDSLPRPMFSKRCLWVRQLLFMTASIVACRARSEGRRRCAVVIQDRP
jgi:hypothetical protein